MALLESPSSTSFDIVSVEVIMSLEGEMNCQCQE